MSYDDDRRYEQRRLDRIADERRQEQRRQDRLADDRRREQQRRDSVEEERRREQRRQDDIDAENRRRDREDEEKHQKERNDLGMSLLRGGNVEAAAAVWDLNIGAVDIPSFAGGRRTAPTLTARPGIVQGFTRLEWTSGTVGTYVLERAYEESFDKPTEIYCGHQTEHVVNTLTDFNPLGPLGLLGRNSPFSDPAPYGAPRYYRVKARDALSGLESPWSNVVKVETPKGEKLPAPKLEMKRDFLLGTTTWKWDAITGATGYVLQRGYDVAFSTPVELYSGENTQYTARTRGDFNRFDPLGTFGTFSSPLGSRFTWGMEFYRVKATGGTTGLDSPWSNVV